MSEKFSNDKIEKKRTRRTGGVISVCAGIFILPVIGTAISKTEVAAHHATLLSNAGFIFSLVLIPLVFFGIYKLDQTIERKVPKRGRKIVGTNDEKKTLRRG